MRLKYRLAAIVCFALSVGVVKWAGAQVCLNPFYGLSWSYTVGDGAPPEFPPLSCAGMGLTVSSGQSCKDRGLYLYQQTLPGIGCYPDHPNMKVKEIRLSINIDTNIAVYHTYVLGADVPSGWTLTTEALGTACGTPINFTATRLILAGPAWDFQGQWKRILTLRFCPVPGPGGTTRTTWASFREPQVFPNCDTYVLADNYDHGCTPQTVKLSITSSNDTSLECNSAADWVCADFPANGMLVSSYTPNGSGGGDEEIGKPTGQPATWTRVKSLYKD